MKPQPQILNTLLSTLMPEQPTVSTDQIIKRLRSTLSFLVQEGIGSPSWQRHITAVSGAIAQLERYQQQQKDQP